MTELPEQPQWWYNDGVKVITIYSKPNIPGTNKEIVPVVKLDDTTIANGKPARRTQTVREKFGAYTAELAKSY